MNNDNKPNNGFSAEQITSLKEPILKEDVKTRAGTGKTTLSYLASFHVIAEANRIFGFDGWDSEILSLNQVDKTEYEKPGYNAGDSPKEMISFAYLCTLRLTVKAGNKVIVREDVGFGDGVAGKSAYGIGSCIELASKEAVTDALKRCMRYYGDKFGLSLYDKGNTNLLNVDEFELSKPVSADQLVELRELYKDRGINDEWVMTALKAEHYTGLKLEDMQQDWFYLALDITKNYNLAEITRRNYEESINKTIKLMGESANFNMLKALFQEGWRKAKEQSDKTKQAELTKVYEEMKAKLNV